MLKQQDDGGDGELRSEGRNQGSVYIRGANLLESPRNGAQYPDRVFAFGVDSVTAVKPRGKGKDDHDESIPQNRDEEKGAGWMDMRLLLTRGVVRDTDHIVGTSCPQNRRRFEWRTRKRDQ